MTQLPIYTPSSQVNNGQSVDDGKVIDDGNLKEFGGEELSRKLIADAHRSTQPVAPTANEAPPNEPCCAPGDPCCSPDQVTQLWGASPSNIRFGTTQFVQGSADSLPFEDAGFDGLTCECAVSTFLDQPRVAGEFYRAIKPGGVFGMTDMVVNGELAMNFSEMRAMLFQSAELVKAGAIQYGLLVFKKVTVHGFRLRNLCRRHFFRGPWVSTQGPYPQNSSSRSDVMWIVKSVRRTRHFTQQILREFAHVHSVYLNP